tara:strand:- start:10548 stop:11027 length:480 start_codon:yes stop_codon:yes gene_type:complete
MLRVIIVACLAAIYAAIASAAPNDRAMIKAPSEWSIEEKASFPGTSGFITLCSMYYKGGYSPAIDIEPFSETDFEIIEGELKKKGLSDFDISILRDKKGNQVAIGQSFAGLVCELRKRVKINKSFIAGVGHRWQAVLPKNFVYFEGDGTSAGMLVTGWN